MLQSIKLRIVQTLDKQHHQIHPVLPNSFLKMFGIFLPYDCDFVCSQIPEVEGLCSLQELSANS